MCDVHETPSFSTNSKVGPFLYTHPSTSMYIILPYKLHVNLAVILSIAYDTVSMVTTSLLPRPERGRRKGPGFHCLHMHLVVVEFRPYHGPSTYVITLMTLKRILNMTWLVHRIILVVLNTAYVMRHCALSNALLQLGTPEVILKTEQWSAVVKFGCGHLQTGFEKYLCFSNLLFFWYVVCRGCVLLEVVWFWLFRHHAASYWWWMR